MPHPLFVGGRAPGLKGLRNCDETGDSIQVPAGQRHPQAHGGRQPTQAQGEVVETEEGWRRL